MPTSTSTVHRPVRAYPPPIPAAELTIAAPPALDRAGPGAAGWLQYLVPLVGSGGSMAFLFAFPGPRPAWLVALVVGAALASVAAGLGLRLAERRAARRARGRERSRYLAHLRQVALQADHLAAAQLAALDHLHPDPPALWAAATKTDRLWERRPADADFLRVRVGRGPVPLAARARLDTSGGPLTEHDPELLDAAEEVVRRTAWLPGAPVVVPLRQLRVLALTGPPERTRALARSLARELAAFHAPDDLRLEVAHAPAVRGAWAWTSRLPHTRGPAGPGRRLVAILDMTEPGGEAGVADLLQRSAAADVTVIWLAGTIAGEPSELSMRARLAGCEALARHLAPLRLGRPPAPAPRPGPVRLLDLLELVDAQPLRVPVGVTANGEPLVLDLNEAAEGGIGPHGLVVGATGSGKSEL